MAGVVQLCVVRVQHAYFNAGKCVHWRFVATPACRELERQYGLRAEPEVEGISLWRETDPARDAALAAQAGDQRLSLQYEVFADEPLLDFLTDWPRTRPVRYCASLDAAPGVPGSADVLQPVLQPVVESSTGAAIVAVLQELKAPAFVLEIAFPEKWLWTVATKPALVARQYVIQLAAKSVHWKYFFTGPLARRKVVIVDMDLDASEANSSIDAGSAQAGVDFEVSPHAATEQGTAWISRTAIPMQQVPVQRFQLREEGLAGRVLIKRLPNASLKMIGKETGHDGTQRLVAEMYIHQ